MRIIILAIILTMFVSGCISLAFEKSITIDCDTCDANTTDISDCEEFYENNKGSVILEKISEKFDINVTDSVNVTGIEKTISYPSQNVGCKYHLKLVK